MKKGLLIVAFFVSCVMAICLCGCQMKKIEFNRESSVAKMYKEMGENTPKKDSVSKSGGVIIYKSADNERNKNVHLGPKDMDFDVKVKF